MDAILQPLLQYGPLGLAVIAFLLGLIVPKWVVDEYRMREKENVALMKDMAVSLRQLAEQTRRA
jgi:pilus assembly protein TadC